MGEKRYASVQRGGSPDQGERREREGERVNRTQGITQEKYIPKTTDKEKQRLIIVGFYKQ